MHGNDKAGVPHGLSGSFFFFFFFMVAPVAYEVPWSGVESEPQLQQCQTP